MKLHHYLKSNGLTYGAFAAMIGASSPRTVQRYVTQERIPRPPIMARITAATGGLVTAADFYAAPESLAASATAEGQVTA